MHLFTHIDQFVSYVIIIIHYPPSHLESLCPVINLYSPSRALPTFGLPNLHLARPWYCTNVNQIRIIQFRTFEISRASLSFHLLGSSPRHSSRLITGAGVQTKCLVMFIWSTVVFSLTLILPSIYSILRSCNNLRKMRIAWPGPTHLYPGVRVVNPHGRAWVQIWSPDIRFIWEKEADPGWSSRIRPDISARDCDLCPS